MEGRQDDIARLYEHAACGLLVTTETGVIRQVNRTFCNWLGREPAELIGLVTVQSLLTVGGRMFHQTHWAPLLQIQGSVSEVKLEAAHKDGRRIPMVWNAVRRQAGDVVTHELAVFVAEDRHKYEEELRLAKRRAEDALRKEQATSKALQASQAERDRLQWLAEDRALFAEQMMAVVSHDLRNPLSVIRMSAHLIGCGELSERQLRSLTQLNASAGRAVRLIGDLLDFSQARMGGGLQVDRTAVDVHAVVAEGIDDLRTAYPGAVLEHVTAGSGPAFASADRLLQMIGNLVSNAVTYGEHGRPVVTTSTIEESTFSIIVSNEGPPIPEPARATLFDPMTRGVSGESRIRSLGLGLYIVRQIAEAHGGTVSVQSSVDRGTTFTATFPRIIPSDEVTATLDPLALGTNRQHELDRLEIATLHDTAYDDIIRLAAATFEVPIALISLVDGDHQWFKARVGLQAAETLREDAFCAFAIEEPGQVMVVADASIDPRFGRNPWVTGHPHIRFYAGAPLVSSSGHALGTVCLIDTEPRTLDETQIETLQFMAQQIVTMLEQRVQGVLRRNVTGSAAPLDG